MDRVEVMTYLRKSLDNNLTDIMRRGLNSLSYSDTFYIRGEVRKFEEVIKYLEDNLK